MQTRTFVSFTSSSFSDDYKDAVDSGLFAGQLLSKYLASELNHRGFVAETPEMDDFAWTFYVRRSGNTFWMHVGESGDGEDRWLVVANSTLGFALRLLGKTDVGQMQELCRHLHEILVADERVANILWYTEAEFTESASLGSPTPS